MIISKEFKWEAAHRLPRHEGKCRHLHGHSYRMVVALEGTVDEMGIVIDYSEIKSMLASVVALMDHTTLISESDMELRETFDSKKWNYFLLPFESTAENLCLYFCRLLEGEHGSYLKARNITQVGVTVFETSTSSASFHITLGED